MNESLERCLAELRRGYIFCYIDTIAFLANPELPTLYCKKRIAASCRTILGDSNSARPMQKPVQRSAQPALLRLRCQSSPF